MDGKQSFTICKGKENLLYLLKNDFQKMLDEQMFYGDRPSFGHIMEIVSTVEDEINTVTVR